jgi:hypothetical protein
MNNEVILAVVKALNEEFNADDKYEIYSEEIKQDLKEPAFFIQLLNPSVRGYLGKRYLNQLHILIQYFPKSATAYQAECVDIGERLQWLLEWITCAGDDAPIQGTNMHHEITDGVLNFFVDYKFTIRKVEDETPMESYTLNQTEKKGV